MASHLDDHCVDNMEYKKHRPVTWPFCFRANSMPGGLTAMQHSYSKQEADHGTEKNI